MDERAQTNGSRTIGALAGAALLPAAPALWGSRAPRPRLPLNKALVGNAPRREVLRSAAVLAAGLLLFYEQARGALGRSPASYRRGGGGVVMRYTLADSALGRVLVAATEFGMTPAGLRSSP